MIGSLVMTVALAVGHGWLGGRAGEAPGEDADAPGPRRLGALQRGGHARSSRRPRGRLLHAGRGRRADGGHGAQGLPGEDPGRHGRREGWEKISLGLNPGAKKRERGRATEEGEDKVALHTYVGCNGKTTWSLIFTMNDKKKDRFEPLAVKIAQSVSYAKGK